MSLNINTYYNSSGSAKYRWGFNGMEKDDNLKGTGNSYDFGTRMYDPRIGRWKVIDKMHHLQPDQSTYKSFLNNPLFYKDEDGKIEVDLITIIDKRTGAEVTFGKVLSNDVFKAENRSEGGLGGALLTKVRVWRDKIHQTTVVINEDGSFTVSKSEKFGKERLTRRGLGRDNALIANAIMDNIDAIKALATLDFEGPGESQAGGVMLTTKGYSYSPTKTQGENRDIHEVEADELVSALGGLSGGGINNTSNTIIRLLNNLSNFESFINSLNDAVNAVVDDKIEINSQSETVQTGDTVRCKYCIERGDSSGFIIQGSDTRDHVTPTNEDVPNEEEDN